MPTDPGLYHEFESQVVDDETEGLIKPQAHWNAKHKPYKLLGYELVEEKKDFSGVSNVTFDGLNGDEDIEYLFEYILSVANGKPDPMLFIRPNSISSGYNSQLTRNWLNTGNALYNTTLLLLSTHGIKGATIYQYGNVKIYAKTGLPRLSIGEGVSISSTESMTLRSGGVLIDSVTNITSFLFGIESSTFSGTIRLWKKIPI